MVVEKPDKRMKKPDSQGVGLFKGALQIAAPLSILIQAGSNASTAEKSSAPSAMTWTQSGS